MNFPVTTLRRGGRSAPTFVAFSPLHCPLCQRKRRSYVRSLLPCARAAYNTLSTTTASAATRVVITGVAGMVAGMRGGRKERGEPEGSRRKGGAGAERRGTLHVPIPQLCPRASTERGREGERERGRAATMTFHDCRCPPERAGESKQPSIADLLIAVADCTARQSPLLTRGERKRESVHADGGDGGDREGEGVFNPGRPKQCAKSDGSSAR